MSVVVINQFFMYRSPIVLRRNYLANNIVFKCMSIFYHKPRYSSIPLIIRRSFVSSPIKCAKAKKQKSTNIIEEDVVDLPNVVEIETMMLKRIQKMEEDFALIKGGRVNSDVFKNISVVVNGSRLILADISQISVENGTRVTISLFDPSLATLATNAIRDSDLNINPVLEGNKILVNVPKPSKESRELAAKSASKTADKVKYCILCYPTYLFQMVMMG